MKREQLHKLENGLANIVGKLNKEFPDLGKFRLRLSKSLVFRIRRKKHWYSREIGDTEIEICFDRIGYSPTISSYGRIIDEYLEEFAKDNNMRIGALSDF